MYTLVSGRWPVQGNTVEACRVFHQTTVLVYRYNVYSVRWRYTSFGIMYRSQYNLCVCNQFVGIGLYPLESRSGNYHNSRRYDLNIKGSIYRDKKVMYIPLLSETTGSLRFDWLLG